jgi:hypothetical protein
MTKMFSYISKLQFLVKELEYTSLIVNNIRTFLRLQEFVEQGMLLIQNTFMQFASM